MTHEDRLKTRKACLKEMQFGRGCQHNDFICYHQLLFGYVFEYAAYYI